MVKSNYMLGSIEISQKIIVLGVRRWLFSRVVPEESLVARQVGIGLNFAADQIS